ALQGRSGQLGPLEVLHQHGGVVGLERDPVPRAVPLVVHHLLDQGLAPAVLAAQRDLHAVSSIARSEPRPRRARTSSTRRSATPAGSPAGRRPLPGTRPARPASVRWPGPRAASAPWPSDRRK